MNKIKQTITSVLLVTVFSAFAMSANASSCRWIGNHFIVIMDLEDHK